MLRERKPQIRTLSALRDEVTLVPFSGVQMLDFGFDLSALEVRAREFIERITGEEDDQAIVTLFPLTGDGDRDGEVLDARRDDDKRYSIRPVNAMEPFLEKWVPVPVLRIKPQRGPAGEEQYDPGPSSWARMRTVELEQPDPETGPTHRVQLAFATAALFRRRSALPVRALGALPGLSPCD